MHGHVNVKEGQLLYREVIVVFRNFAKALKSENSKLPIVLRPECSTVCRVRVFLICETKDQTVGVPKKTRQFSLAYGINK